MRRFLFSFCLSIAVFGMLLSSDATAQNPPLAGAWSLNRAQSEVPQDLGFSVNWLPSQGGSGGSDQPSGSSGGGGGRGRRGSGGGGRGGAAGAFATTRESYEDARRVQLLTGEARNPPTRLTIVDTTASVTMTNELGQSRTVHPTGHQESVEIQGVGFAVTTKRDGDQLVVTYNVEQGREIRYTFSRSSSAPQLIVDVEFLEHGSGDKAKLVYDSGVASETASAPPASAPGSASGTPPPAPATPSEKFDERPGAELKGLQSLGVLVEDLSSQAVSCGLNHDALEGALSKRLTDGGFTVRRNSDEDTYLYVNVMTSTLPNGTCVSRYDAFLYTHATAKLSYRDQPVLVQVSLMHRGGIGSSAPTAHAAAVSRGLESYVDVFITQIRNANK